MKEELINEMRDAIFADDLEHIKNLIEKNKNLINAVTDFGSFCMMLRAMENMKS